MMSRQTEEDALAEQLLKHHDAFLAFIRKRVADPELAADVLQDSLLKAIRASGTIRGRENVIAWFYRILRRTIIDLYRHRAADQRAMHRFERERTPKPSAADERALCRCLLPLLPTLKPEYATVIRRLDIDEADPARVAAEQGVTLNNLKVRLHRARRELRARLIDTCKLCAKHRCLDCTCGA